MNGKKTPPEVVYQIMTTWATNRNYKQTAEETGVPVTTVKRMVEKHKDKPEFQKLLADRVASFIKKAERVADKALDRIEQDIDNPDKDIAVNHLTTVIGVLTDKSLLLQGKATENVAVEVKLPPEVNEYAE